MIDAHFPSSAEIRQDAVANTLSLLTMIIDLTTEPALRDQAKRQALELFAQHWEMTVHITPSPAGWPDALNPYQAAAFLEIAPSTIYKYLADGTLASRDVHGQRMIQRSDLMALGMRPKAERPGQGKGVA